MPACASSRPRTELPFAGHPSVGTACVLVDSAGAGGRAVHAWCSNSASGRPGRGRRPPRPAVGATVHQGPPRFPRRCRVRPPPRSWACRSTTCTPISSPAVVGTGLDYAIIPLREQDALGRIALDGSLVAAFERDYAEVYPVRLHRRGDPWIEARGLFPLCGSPKTRRPEVPPVLWRPTSRAPASWRRVRRGVVLAGSPHRSSQPLERIGRGGRRRDRRRARRRGDRRGDDRYTHTPLAERG